VERTSYQIPGLEGLKSIPQSPGGKLRTVRPDHYGPCRPFALTPLPKLTVCFAPNHAPARLRFSRCDVSSLSATGPLLIPLIPGMIQVFLVPSSEKRLKMINADCINDSFFTQNLCPKGALHPPSAPITWSSKIDAYSPAW
jgi:hypothetical protein